MTGRSSYPARPLLRAPPFPGARPQRFAVPMHQSRSEAELDKAIEGLGRARVGGAYWGSQPILPEDPYFVVSVRDPATRARILAHLPADSPIMCPGDLRTAVLSRGHSAQGTSGCCDPWHVVSGAREIFADIDDELSIVAALAGKRLNVVGSDHSIQVCEGRRAVHALLRQYAAMNFDYSNPFTGEPIELGEAINLCAFWRGMIDSNRPLVAALGFAAWKRPTVAPLLWGGSTEIAFVATAKGIGIGEEVAIWKSRVAESPLKDLQRIGARLVEVEDGFIRSVGLGAECVPPLSIVVDRLGPYFDPSTPSDLEMLIQNGIVEPLLLARARSLRELIVAQGVSKYAAGRVVLERPIGSQRYLLVTGQVEDDRSVMSGGGAVRTNLELLRRVRSLAPDAFIIYKPHPDVEAGHRVGDIPRQTALTLANEVMSDVSISALIDIVDEVHVNTSLAGFEALLRGRPVVTHGVPFYAGWGLTRDLGDIPGRRTARRTLDELVAAVLLLYPRYLDPHTGLPCPPEVLIRRLTIDSASRHDSLLVTLRRLQGRVKRRIAWLREGRRG